MQEILDEYKGITIEDVQACILFASKALENITFMPPLSLQPDTTQGKPGEWLVRFAGTISNSDLTDIEKAIEDDCEQINRKEW
jgi:hypothetical protein